MLLRAIAITALVAVLAGFAIHLQRGGAWRTWLGGAEGTPKPFVFDNGTIRDNPAPASAPKQATLQSPPGVLRKCVRGDTVTYSNLDCPIGTRERPIKADTVTVLPAIEAPLATLPNKPAGKTHAALQNALDLKRDEELRRRMIDRAIGDEAK